MQSKKKGETHDKGKEKEKSPAEPENKRGENELVNQKG